MLQHEDGDADGGANDRAQQDQTENNEIICRHEKHLRNFVRRSPILQAGLSCVTQIREAKWDLSNQRGPSYDRAFGYRRVVLAFLSFGEEFAQSATGAKVRTRSRRHQHRDVTSSLVHREKQERDQRPERHHNWELPTSDGRSPAWAMEMLSRLPDSCRQ